MPSKIQQIAAMLDGLDNYELESIRSIANQVIENRRGTSCKLLELPPELRNLIYHFVAKAYITSYGSYDHNGARCGLFGANKQLRIEFMDMCYDKEIVGEIQLASCEMDVYGGHAKKISWAAAKGTKIQKLMLDSGRDIKGPSWTNAEDAERWAVCCIESETWDVEDGIVTADESRIYGVHKFFKEDDSGGMPTWSGFAIKNKVIWAKSLEDELPVLADGKIKLI